MTDIAFKKALDTQQGHPGYYVTGGQRQRDARDFTSTHFIMGKHPTTHYSQSALKS